MWGELIGGALSLIGDVWSSNKGASSAAAANRTNLQISREQRAWEENMANTAVQRRADDIEKAGFNRVLAATGAGAATPSVSTPPMQPTFRPEWLKGSGAGALLLKEQLLNLRANTAKTAAEARDKNVEADIRESLKGSELLTRANKFIEQEEWDNLRTRILRATAASSAAGAKIATETVDALIQRAKQDTRKGKLDLDALENIAKLGGIEAGRALPILKMFVDLFKD